MEIIQIRSFHKATNSCKGVLSIHIGSIITFIFSDKWELKVPTTQSFCNSKRISFFVKHYSRESKPWKLVFLGNEIGFFHESMLTALRTFKID